MACARFLPDTWIGEDLRTVHAHFPPWTRFALAVLETEACRVEVAGGLGLAPLVTISCRIATEMYDGETIKII